MRSTVSRRRTCPITRTESEQLMDFFLNQVSTPQRVDKIDNNSKNDQEYCSEEETSEFKRSDSYRRATQKFSIENVNKIENTESTFKSVNRTESTFKKEDYDHKKYLSLPVDKKYKVKNIQNNIATSNVTRRNKLNRQISGTVPSSDSDHQTSPSEQRNKKSVFKRTKERILFKLWKDRKQKEKKDKITKQLTQTVKGSKYVPNEYTSGDDSQKGQWQKASIKAQSIELERNNTGKTGESAIFKEDTSFPKKNMAPSISPGNGRKFRSQVSREEITNMFEKILSSAEARDEPFTFPKENEETKKRLNRKDFSPTRDISFADGIRNKKSGLRLNIIPFSTSFTTDYQRSVCKNSTETLVDKHGTKTVCRNTVTSYCRTFSLEIDGADDVDGITETPAHDTTRAGANTHVEPLSPTEQEKMIEEIAKRLNRIADDCVQRMAGGELQQMGGAVAAPLLSPNSKSRKLASDLVTELRKEGDRLSRELNLPDSLLPIVMDMVKQVTYDHFKELVQKALCEAIGWDQVALYFYVARAAIVMAGAGGRLARGLKDMAVRYFHEELSPWIHDRGGLETMLDETDSELD